MTTYNGTSRSGVLFVIITSDVGVSPYRFDRNLQFRPVLRATNKATKVL